GTRRGSPFRKDASLMFVTRLAARIGPVFARVLRAAPGAVVLAGALFAASAAFGAGMPAGGTVRLFVVPGQGQGNGTIVVAGAIGDYGKTHKLSNAGVAELVLQKGTIEVNLAPIQKKL